MTPVTPSDWIEAHIPMGVRRLACALLLLPIALTLVVWVTPLSMPEDGSSDVLMAFLLFDTMLATLIFGVAFATVIGDPNPATDQRPFLPRFDLRIGCAILAIWWSIPFGVLAWMLYVLSGI